jgi:hypothetical protein
MKKLLSPALLFIAAIFLLQSCQREVGFEQNNQNNQVNGSFKWKLDGVQWVANKYAVAEVERGMITLAGITTDKKQLVIILQGDTTGTYQLDNVVMDHVAAYNDSLSSSPFALTTHDGSTPAESGGTVTVTSIDRANKRIKGTFTFKVNRSFDNVSHMITEGSFDLSFDNPPVANNPTDTFRVKINGSTWAPVQLQLSGVSTTFPLSVIAINAFDNSNDKGIGLSFPLNITPGSYTLDFWQLTHIGQYFPDDDPDNGQVSVSGTLQVLEHNTSTKRIRANFNFRAENMLDPSISTQISEGYFSVKYQ